MPKLHTLQPYQRRLIRSGNVIELYDYEKPVIRGSGARRGRANQAFTSKETKQENRSKTANRARAKVRRIINANPLTAFIKVFRAVVLDGVTPPAILHVQSLVWCAIALIVGSLVFKKSQDSFILKI